ncbi:Pup deamidase/depupylase [Corynebacterium deserti GIMN1.010]|uniref:Pup deamidase/depupylase n=1 Tax=Corynebacterium deserti GIMN1.010 TaxID=931089 RepID=A0A0M4CIF1_9CORY|nr:depupylase/deamidase Dop [Corynebacterium deserti]ALC05858.1 Pup deamidase/depupylase [Corynebacterium deserti GIMN1.010]
MRYMGSETEYGISTPSAPLLSPIITSTHTVVAYSVARGFGDHRVRWDYQDETPLRDTRGFDLRRYHQAPVVDPHSIGVANVFIPNGARFYVDHAHPEYSSPEVWTARDAALYDAAGDHILLQAVADVAGFSSQDRSVLDGHDPCPPLKIYKNNVDGKGASYGSHENYLYSRETPFDDIAQGLIPFFVARQVIIGAGRVGLGPQGDKPGFQISQRADYIEQEISLETTLNRGIINTRDEPHTGDNDGRLHVIIGDANMSHTSNFLKFGMTEMVLNAIERHVDFSDLKLANPVKEVKAVSRDLTLTHKLTLANGSELTAIEILREYLQRSQDSDGDDGNTLGEVAQKWAEILTLLESDPMSTRHLLDWTAKLALIRSYEARGVAINDPKMSLIDLQYSDIDPQKSLYHALVKKGRMEIMFSAEDIAHAAAEPPNTSRAYFRGRLMEKFGDHVLAANWESLLVRSSTGEKYRMYTTDLGAFVDWTPTGVDMSHVLIDEVSTIDQLIERLERLNGNATYITAVKSD